MTVSYNPSAVINGLLLNLDFANPKGFQYQENFFRTSNNFNSGYWVYTASSSTATIATLAPDGSTTAFKLIGGAGQTGRKSVYQGATIYSTGSQYTFSVYLKAAEFTSATIWFDTVNVTPSAYYGAGALINLANGSIGGASPGQVSITSVGNSWYRCQVTASPITTGTINFQIAQGDANGVGTDAGNGTSGIYLWGPQIESNVTATGYTVVTGITGIIKNLTTSDIISKNQANNYYQSNYISYNPSGYLQFTRYPATTSTQKAGGNLQITNPLGGLSVTNFLYYDHTWEIWFKIDDINPVTIPGDPSEGFSALALYNGYHAGFSYNSSFMTYGIFSLTNFVNCGVYSIGTSGAMINQGSWYQLAVSRTGNTCTSYINGQQTGTIYTVNIATTSVVTSNNINIGSAYPVVNNLGYNYSYLGYAKNSISIMRMYNRGLSAAEIQQNFNANRGRYGL
jgi:hypothetical protein